MKNFSGIGYGLNSETIKTPAGPIVSYSRAPTQKDTKYSLGQEWYYYTNQKANVQIYKFCGLMSSGQALWIEIGNNVPASSTTAVVLPKKQEEEINATLPKASQKK